MTTSRKSDPIRKITTKSGETRYRFIIDVGKRPDGKRDQRCYTFTKLGEARAERAKIISDRSRGALVKPTKATLAEAVTAWLEGRRNLPRARSVTMPTASGSCRTGSATSSSRTSPRPIWTIW
jgi:hypothetical protein